MGSEHNSSQDSEDDFEFAILSKDNDDLVDADEIFVHGIIRPFYLFSEDSDWWYRNVCIGKESREKVVGKIPLDKLIMMVKEGEEQEQEHRQLSDVELDGIPVGTYCLWTPGSSSPSPDMKTNRKKTKSMGGTLWGLRNLILRWSLSQKTEADGDCRKRLSAPPYKKDSLGMYTGVGGMIRAVR